MAALTEKVEIFKKEGLMHAPPMAVDEIFQGGLIKINAAGFAEPCSTEAGAKFAGIAQEDKDNSTGSAGDERVKIHKDGIHLLIGTGFSATDVGEPVFASDDATITKTFSTDLQRVGVIEEFESSTKVWVRIQVDQDNGAASITDLGAFTDPPSAGEMATLRTAVNDVLAVLREHRMIQG